MDPATLVILGLVQASKLAMTLIENVQNGAMTPEEAQQKWQQQAASFNQTADMWFATPDGRQQ